MTSSDAALRHLDDPALPGLRAMLCDPLPLLAAAMAAGDAVVRHARPRQATWVPGRSLTVRYDARVTWPSGTAVESVVATTGRLPEGAVVVTGDGCDVAVWRVPHDPRLPGLGRLAESATLDALLDDLGVARGRAQQRLVAYRPGRRAVLRVSRAGRTVFLKVVRPDRAESLHRRHRAFVSGLPVPQSLGWSAELGVVALQSLGGSVMRQALLSRRRLPTPGQLLLLLDRLPDTGDGAASAGWGARAFAPLLARLRPALADAVTELTERLAAAEDAYSAPTVPVHGDYHEAQLLVDRGQVTGVLDLDTAASGHRIEDLATMIGHLSTLALGSPRRAAVERYAAYLLRVFDRHVDPVALRHAVAATVLGLATGPFRVLEERWPARVDERIRLAQRWAESAHRVSRRPAPVAG